MVERSKILGSSSIRHPDYLVHQAIEEFLAQDSQHNTILDYGCGNSLYQDLFKYEKYIKADIDSDIKISNTLDIILSRGKADVPLKDSSINCILCMDVLEHSGGLASRLDEFYRVLKTGGVCFISIPFLYREHEMPYDLYRYTSSCMIQKAKKSGFKITHIHKIGSLSYVLYMLWYGSIIKEGEKIEVSFFGKIIRKLFNMIVLPVCNKFIFTKRVPDNSSVYAALLIKIQK